jgi:hypothetical protein
VSPGSAQRGGAASFILDSSNKTHPSLYASPDFTNRRRGHQHLPMFFPKMFILIPDMFLLALFNLMHPVLCRFGILKSIDILITQQY